MRAWILVVLVALAGCALTSKRGQVDDVRWFTPERASATTAEREPSSGPPLRLGRVSAGTDLGKRIAYGDGAYEVGYYDTLRWTERPEHYVRDALGRALFGSGSFQRALGDSVPILDVEVLAFQELRGPVHAARVSLRIALATDVVILEDTIESVVPVTGDGFEDVVAAVAGALGRVSLETACRVSAALPSEETHPRQASDATCRERPRSDSP